MTHIEKTLKDAKTFEEFGKIVSNLECQKSNFGSRRYKVKDSEGDIAISKVIVLVKTLSENIEVSEHDVEELTELKNKLIEKDIEGDKALTGSGKFFKNIRNFFTTLGGGSSRETREASLKNLEKTYNNKEDLFIQNLLKSPVKSWKKNLLSGDGEVKIPKKERERIVSTLIKGEFAAIDIVIELSREKEFNFLFKDVLVGAPEELKNKIFQKVDNQNNSIAHLAVKSGNIEGLRQILETEKTSDLSNFFLFSPNKEGNSLLHLAAETNNVEMMKLIFKQCPEDFKEVQFLKNDAEKLPLELSEDESIKQFYKTNRPQDLVKVSEKFQKELSAAAIAKSSAKKVPKFSEKVTADVKKNFSERLKKLAQEKNLYKIRALVLC